MMLLLFFFLFFNNYGVLVLWQARFVAWSSILFLPTFWLLGPKKEIFVYGMYRNHPNQASSHRSRCVNYFSFNLYLWWFCKIYVLCNFLTVSHRGTFKCVVLIHFWGSEGSSRLNKLFHRVVDLQNKVEFHFCHGIGTFNTYY